MPTLSPREGVQGTYKKGLQTEVILSSLKMGAMVCGVRRTELGQLQSQTRCQGQRPQNGQKQWERGDLMMNIYPKPSTKMEPQRRAHGNLLSE